MAKSGVWRSGEKQMLGKENNNRGGMASAIAQQHGGNVWHIAKYQAIMAQHNNGAHQSI